MKNLLRSSIVAATLISGAGTVLASAPPREQESNHGANRLAQRADQDGSLRQHKAFKREAGEYRNKPNRVIRKKTDWREDV